MSDQDTDMFSGESGNPTSSQPQADNFDALLDGIKNESGQRKYDSVPKALEGLTHAQQFISTLKSEKEQLEARLKELEQQASTTASVEEVVKRLTAKDQPKDDDKGTPPAEAPKGLDEAAVAKLVQDVLAKQNAASVQENNLKQVTSKLAAKYGDKAKDEVAKKASEMGITVERLKQLASESPQLVESAFGLQATQSGPKPTSGSFQTPQSGNTPASLERPTKSLLTGATAKEQAEYMKRVREEVYRQHGIQS